MIKYHVSLPTEEAQHAAHPTCGVHLMAQRINPTVAQKKCQSWWEKGMTELQEILITMSTQSCVLTVLLTLMIELIIQQIVI